jgi:hypothetical protein
MGYFQNTCIATIAKDKIMHVKVLGLNILSLKYRYVRRGKVR